MLRPGEDGGYDVERAASLIAGRLEGARTFEARVEALRRGVERAAAVGP